MARLKGKKFYVGGVAYDIDVEEFKPGDGETNTAGYIEKEERRVAIDNYHQDDSTLSHELGHAIADQAGVYLSETQMVVWEMLFAALRDPRNKWLREYYFGEPKKKKKG